MTRRDFLKTFSLSLAAFLIAPLSCVPAPEKPKPIKRITAFEPAEPINGLPNLTAKLHDTMWLPRPVSVGNMEFSPGWVNTAAWPEVKPYCIDAPEHPVRQEFAL